MLPNQVTQLLGVSDTADYTAISIDPNTPFEIGREMWRYNPMEHQLLTWLMRNARYRPTVDQKFGHLEKSYLPNMVQFTGATESSQGTSSLTFNNGAKRLAQYSRVRTPSGEVILFKADFASAHVSAAVDRNFGTSGTPLLKNGDWCVILSPNPPEGATMTKGAQQEPGYVSFNTSICDFPVEMTGTKAAVKTVEGDAFATSLTDAWEQSSSQLEAAALFSGGVSDTSTYTYPMHAATGLEDYITTNVFSVDGFLTRMDLWDIIAEWRKYYKGPGAIVTSNEIIQTINTMAFPKVQYDQNLTADGIDISAIVVPGAGRYALLECDLLGMEMNLAGYMFLLPTTGIDYRPLIGTKNREIGYVPLDRKAQGIDQEAGHIFGEFGWEFFGEERFGVVKGLKF